MLQQTLIYSNFLPFSFPFPPLTFNPTFSTISTSLKLTSNSFQRELLFYTKLNQMQNDAAAATAGEVSDNDIEKQRSDKAEDGDHSLQENAAVDQSQDLANKIIDVVVVEFPSKGEPQLARVSTSNEECRVCQEEKEEDLISLGCRCQGGLAKAHHSCIIKWFSIRGSNKCEICKQVAGNVEAPDSQTSHWVWTVDPAVVRAQDHRRRCTRPLWVAFSIVLGGLLLDVLISVTVGVSALPVNIIIGVIAVVGLATAIRLGLEVCQEWNVRRVVQRVEANASLGYHPAL